MLSPCWPAWRCDSLVGVGWHCCPPGITVPLAGVGWRCCPLALSRPPGWCRPPSVVVLASSRSLSSCPGPCQAVLVVVESSWASSSRPDLPWALLSRPGCCQAIQTRPGRCGVVLGTVKPSWRLSRCPGHCWVCPDLSYALLSRPAYRQTFLILVSCPGSSPSCPDPCSMRCCQLLEVSLLVVGRFVVGLALLWKGPVVERGWGGSFTDNGGHSPCGSPLPGPPLLLPCLFLLNLSCRLLWCGRRGCRPHCRVVVLKLWPCCPQ